MSKHLVLMRDVICKYHPRFRKSEDIRRFGLEAPEHFNIERLVEESLAAVGGYKFVDEEGYDFSDFSDSKTTSINYGDNSATVMGVECKIGALRIVAYNPFKNASDYFFVPKDEVHSIKRPCYGKNAGRERIVFRYSTAKKDYTWFERYRMSSFRKLALAS